MIAIFVVLAVFAGLWGTNGTGEHSADAPTAHDDSADRPPPPRSRGPPAEGRDCPADGCSDPSRPFDPQIQSSAAVPNDMPSARPHQKCLTPTTTINYNNRPTQTSAEGTSGSDHREFC